MRHGQQRGEWGSGGRGRRSMTAEGFRRRFAWLNSFTDEELRKISFCDESEELKPGEQYLDLSHPETGVITAEKGQRSPEGSCYVGRGDVSASLWRKLTTPFGSRGPALGR